MNKVDLKAILAKHYNMDTDEEGNKCYYDWQIKELAKEVWSLAVDECASLQKTKYTAGETGYLDAESIQELKEIIK